MFTFLLIVHILISASLVAVILMQRSEGGGLTSGGNPGGLMSARGAADFLTRATAVLATVFVVLSILLAALATMQRGHVIDTSLARRGAVPVAASPAAAPTATQNGAPPADNGAVPIQH